MRYVVLALIFLVGLAHAQTAPLLPETVIQSVERHYPALLAAEAEQRVAAGERLSAEGAFDTVIESRLRGRLAGFYSGDIASVEATKPLAPLGAEVYGGYRLSQGDFPIYEDEYFTNQGGEAKVGVLFSLLRNRTIDSRRAGILEAELGLSEAALDVLIARLEVQERAQIAYWQWVTAGRERQAYAGLLALAERRDVALRREVSSGARAAIFLTENAQNLTRRRDRVRRADLALALAANDLALYLRDENGEPIVPSPEQQPLNLDLPSPVSLAELASIVDGQPELRLLKIARQRLELKRDLARNDLLPNLDLKVEAGDDFGAIGPGGISRDDAEVIAGVTLKVPFGRRDARGRVRSANARLDALEQRQRLLSDRIAQEIRKLTVSIETAEELLKLATLEAQQAAELEEAERRRFRNGASDFFLVNIREQTAANARVRVAEAELALAAARISYLAATFDIERLTSGG
ncbi:TolC family protein [Parvularcula sp. ZS-1/3]|uniref:TolC family protein n=1 Tax=Parvularcula mediterranea TaxID=2732508 RepID=A0A7Y3W4V6_9PROT|nr:TolC family protein [Parvularcula mediterranea]NNU15954.1 TolC family protein [Parvularcula mediterranea]